MNNHTEQGTNNHQINARNSEHFTNLPSLILMDNWKYWIACEIVKRWQTSPEKDFQLLKEEVLNISEEKIVLLSQNRLNQEIKKIKEGYDIIKDTPQIETAIKNYLVEVNIPILEERVKHSESKRINKIRQLISAYCQDVSPANLSSVLENLCFDLKTQKNEIEEKRRECYRKSSKAYQDHLEFLKEFESFSSESKEVKDIGESSWKSISLYFEFYLKAEAYSLFNANIWSLLYICTNYQNSVKLSSDLLLKIQGSLEQKSKFEIITYYVNFYIDQIDSESHKRKIELWLDERINYWSDRKVSWQQIEEKLLKNIEPDVFEICKDFQSRYLDLDLQ